MATPFVVKEATIVNKHNYNPTMEYPQDLLLIQQLIYNACGYNCTGILKEEESDDYNAYTFKLDNRAVKFRSAKITPTKVGQFVTLWKRDEAGITQPHDDADPIDLFVISTRKDDLFGQFVFTKQALVKNGILSTPQKEGKRGFRVYPPWDLTTNKQAQKTQQWQLEFFLDMSNLNSETIERAHALYL